MIGLAAFLHLFDENPAFLLDLVGGNLVPVHGDRRCGGDVLGYVFDELLEVVRARDEISLAIHLHQHTDLAVVMDVTANHALARLLADALLGLGDPPCAEILDRFLHVAVVLLERLLRFHHPGARSLAQSLNIFRSEFLFCRHYRVS